VLVYKGIKKIFRKFEFCAKVLSLFVENLRLFTYFNGKIRPKITDTRLKYLRATTRGCPYERQVFQLIICDLLWIIVGFDIT